MQKKQIKLLSILVILLAISLAVVSYFGVFVSSTYTLDSVSMRTQGIGQDMVDLFFVVPLLLISLILTSKNNYKGILLLAGTLFYILYSFIIYALGVHFNQMFLLYCSTLGLSLFSFIVKLKVKTLQFHCSYFSFYKCFSFVVWIIIAEVLIQ